MLIVNLKPYAEVKNSGSKWLREVPEHWDVVPLAGIGRLFKGNGGSKVDEVDKGVPCVRYGDLYTQHEFFIRNAKACVTCERASSYTSLQNGDLLFAASGETFEDIGKSAVNLLNARAVCGGDILVFHPDLKLVPRFLGYAADSNASKNQKACMGRGFTVVHIYASQLKRLQLTIPPLTEQSSIVHFLDHIDRRIHRYIRTKKKLVSLLGEYKQAIINHAVTKGLDPDVRMKPSGIEWMGEIPEHWEVRPAKWFLREVDERTSAGSEELLSVSHITGVTPRSQKTVTMFKAASYVGHKFCQPGDLVVNTMWAWMGAMGVAEQVGIVSPSYAVYRPLESGSFSGQYIDALLRTKDYISEYRVRSTGIRSSRLRLYPDYFLRIPLIRPPIGEQKSIVEFINRVSNEVDAEISHAHSKMGLLREYRTRLISDVVTGKVDVREIAIHLPVEEVDEELLDEFDSQCQQGEDDADTSTGDNA